MEQNERPGRAWRELAFDRAGGPGAASSGGRDGEEAYAAARPSPTLAHAGGIRDRVPPGQPGDAERRARPAGAAAGAHRMAGERRGCREPAPSDRAFRSVGQGSRSGLYGTCFSGPAGGVAESAGAGHAPHGSHPDAYRAGMRCGG